DGGALGAALRRVRTNRAARRRAWTRPDLTRALQRLVRCIEHGACLEFRRVLVYGTITGGRGRNSHECGGAFGWQLVPSALSPARLTMRKDEMRYEKRPEAKSMEPRRKVIADFPSGMVLSVSFDGFDELELQVSQCESRKPSGKPP